MDYEGHICRAPMERASFMLPVMVGCSYNACKFCNLFKHLRFRQLPFAQVEAECARVKAAGGSPKKVFFGDGNAFSLKTEDLLRLASMAREYFPQLQMINMDATVTSILEKTDAELRALREAGVQHLYLGIESGLDDVLRFMHKDHTLPEAYLAVERIQKAGMIFDAHIMTGVAGHGRGRENAEALLEFFRQTKPARICNFSMFLQDGVPLYKDILGGAFIPADETENLEEDRILTAGLGSEESAPVLYDSFHDYIAYRVRGTLPRDRAKMLTSLDKAIAGRQERQEPEYAFVYGECPSLFDSRTGRYIWDTEKAG